MDGLTSYAIESFRVFAYNKNQMFLPNHDKIFGSHYLKIESPSKSVDPSSVDKPDFYQEYAISITHLMNMDLAESRCNTCKTKENTTKCITNYLEEQIGCSMGLQGSTSGLKRC